jgi:hypothetical protein
MRKSPILGFVFLAVMFYLGDCLIAHKAHPEVAWLESGVYCRGPFGFIATVAVIVAGIGYCLKKGY